MLSASERQVIAEQMRAVQAGKRQMVPVTSTYPAFDLPSAYAVAQRVHRARLAEGAVAVGRKIGFTNRNIWPTYGVRQPIWGYMYEDTVERIPAAGGTCSIGRFVEPKIEPEIVFHFNASPPPGATPARVLECIDWVAHGFEMVQSHFPNWVFQMADTVADGGLHGALLLGEPQPIERLGADLIETLCGFSLDLSCNGDIRDSGVGANVLGSPLIALAHLIEALSRQPEATPIQAGEIVTTGTITAAFPAHAGDTWQTSLRGIAIPGLQVTLVA